MRLNLDRAATRREQQHQAVHGRSADARRRLAAHARRTRRGSRAATSAATRRSSARGTRSTSTWRSRCRPTNDGFLDGRRLGPGPRDVHVDHRRARVPLRRQQRPGADALRDPPHGHARRYASRYRRSSASPAAPSEKLDYQAGLYFFNIKTDTTGRNYNGSDAGAFFATNAQYAALDNAPGHAAAASVAERRARHDATRIPRRTARPCSAKSIGTSPKRLR